MTRKTKGPGKGDHPGNGHGSGESPQDGVDDNFNEGAGGVPGDGMDEGDDCYEVGYGKPPKSGRFKPGQSGNPRGRKKGTRGLKTDLLNELSAKSSIRINGKEVKGTRQQLMIMTQSIRAAAGDLKASALLLPIILQVLGVEDRNAGKAKLSSNDQALLDALMAEIQDDDPPLDAAADSGGDGDGDGHGDGCGRHKPPADSAEETDDGEPGDD